MCTAFHTMGSWVLAQQTQELGRHIYLEVMVPRAETLTRDQHRHPGARLYLAPLGVTEQGFWDNTKPILKNLEARGTVYGAPLDN